MKKNIKLFSLQEYRLLQLSSIIFETQSYHWLKPFFREVRNSGVNEDYFVKKNITSDQLVSIKANKDLWIQQARLEWKYKNAKVFTENQECNLCNQPHLETCYFENKRNKKIIQVGTTCLYTLGDEYEKSRNRELKSERELNNISEIQKSIPDIRNIVDDWSLYLSRTPVVVSRDLEKEYREVCKKLVNLYNKTVKSKNINENLLKLLEVYEQLLLVKLKINTFIENNKKRKYVLSRSIFDEMKFNQLNYANIIDVITGQYNSVITIQTAHKIKSKTFYECFVGDFNKLNKDIKIESVNDFSFKISFKHAKGINFLINGEAFIFSFSDLVLDKPVYDSDSERLEDMLKDIRFFDSSNSEEAINRVLRETNIKYKAYNFKRDSSINKEVKEELRSIKRMIDSKNDYNRILYNINSILYEFEECQKINKYYSLYASEVNQKNKDDYKEQIRKKISKLDRSNIKILIGLNDKETLEVNERQSVMVEFNSTRLNRELQELKKKLIFISNANTDKLVDEVNKLMEISITENSKDFYGRFGVIKTYSLPNDTELETLKEELMEKIIDVSRMKNSLFEFVYEGNIVKVEREKLAVETIRYLLVNDKDKKKKFEKAIETYIENKKSVSKTIYHAELLKKYQATKSRFS
ncbi:hypothetical protein [Vagococcus carniphilus]|uniref:Uncharacterized protein n=1 Tax=Vagococcus carniphilus TaxID=218144 RepID=A0A430B662_9ENTE|nr:hypothetical protein [Vagococcus carniphilus]QNN72694.1 hypothetical protein H9L18_12645 [Vagococcus carniphilus]RSU15800.1 hypothetical protein CBF28_05020 [Vagococcus carniphilus]